MAIEILLLARAMRFAFHRIPPGFNTKLLSFPKYMTVLSPTPSLGPSPVGRGKISPSPTGGRVGKGARPSPIMETSIDQKQTQNQV